MKRIDMDFHYLPKRLRARQSKLYRDLSIPLLRRAYGHDVINKLLSVQPLPDNPCIKAHIEFLMKNDIILTCERE